MKSLKITLYACIIMLISLQQVDCSQTSNDIDNIKQEIFTKSSINPEYIKLMQDDSLRKESDDKNLYTYNLTSIPADDKSKIAFDVKNPQFKFDRKNNFFNNGATITVTIKYLKDNRIWTQIETWTTNHPSYFTWKNNALALTSAGAAYLAYTLVDASKKSLPIYRYKEIIDFYSDPLVARYKEDMSPQEEDAFKNEAYKIMQQHDRKILNMHDIQEAYLNVRYGKHKELFEETAVYQQDKLATTYHEVGHAIAILYNMPTEILEYIEPQARDKVKGLTSSFIHKKNIPYNNDLFRNDTIQYLSGIVSQQVFSQFHTDSKHPEFFNGKMLTDKNKILEFLNLKEASSDMKWINSMLIGNKTKAENFLVDMYKKTFELISKHKKEIEQGVNLIMQKGQMIHGDELYNLLQVDKPLYEFEQGPLPKSLVGNYQYRGYDN